MFIATICLVLIKCTCPVLQFDFTSQIRLHVWALSASPTPHQEGKTRETESETEGDEKGET